MFLIVEKSNSGNSIWFPELFVYKKKCVLNRSFLVAVGFPVDKWCDYSGVRDQDIAQDGFYKVEDDPSGRLLFIHDVFKLKEGKYLLAKFGKTVNDKHGTAYDDDYV